MKWQFCFLGGILGIIGCHFPQVVENYHVIAFSGGDMYYVSYHWKGENFDAAINLIQYFSEVVKMRDYGEQVLASFSANGHWKIGFIAVSPFEESNVCGIPIEYQQLAPGKCADLTLCGYPDFMFTQYGKFKRKLKKDGWNVIMPVYELYQYDTFNNPEIKKQERIGKIRYFIEQSIISK